MEYKSFKCESLEVKREETHLYVEGYAAVYGNIDSYYDIVQTGAFDSFLASEDVKRCKFCFNHDMDDVIGVIEDLRSDEKGLWFKAKVSNTSLGRDVAELISDGALSEFSIGYKTEDSIRQDDGVRLLTKVYLYEISVVSRAANPKATIVETERKDEDVAKEEKKPELSEMSYTQLQEELDGVESRKAEIVAEINARIINAIKL